MRVVEIRVEDRATTVAVFDSAIWLRLPFCDSIALARANSPKSLSVGDVVESEFAPASKLTPLAVSVINP
ncbi:hypothetical protein E4P29_15515 [Rhodococcus sp. 1R11]|uniref:hypothetical protein n=1 Tax=Rhodococcus sp. 1R11 TaxID=2559614 RepID=UPI00107226B0|nr:hypothetical protein [Rhodococcus sp. 1R11]TFI42474.1 hypothetical protein E4P29_15515 [Rhodococcus sp. 1R11]